MGSSHSRSLRSVPFAQIHEFIKLSSDEVQAIKDRYQTLAKASKSGDLEGFELDEETFGLILSLGEEKAKASGNLFQLFDTNGDGVVDFRELIVGLNILHKPDVEKPSDLISIYFKHWDINNDGVISPDEMTLMFETLLKSSMKFAQILTGGFGNRLELVDLNMRDSNVLEGISKIGDYDREKSEHSAMSAYDSIQSGESIDALVKLAFEEADDNRDNVISEEEFVAWVKSKRFLMRFIKDFALQSQNIGARQHAVPRFQSHISVPGFETLLSPLWRTSSAQIRWICHERVKPIANPHWMISGGELWQQTATETYICTIKGASQPDWVVDPPFDVAKDALDDFLKNFVPHASIVGTHPALYDIESYLTSMLEESVSEKLKPRLPGVVEALNLKYGLTEDWLLEQGGNYGHEIIVDGYGPDLLVQVGVEGEGVRYIPIPVMPPLYTGPEIWNTTQWMIFTRWNYLEQLYGGKITFSGESSEEFKKMEVQGLILLHILRLMLLFNKFNGWKKLELVDRIMSLIESGVALEL